MEKVFARDCFSSPLSVCSIPHLAKPFPVSCNAETVNNTMKYLISFFLLFFISSCEKQNRSEINYINLYSTSIVRIDCENLKKSSNLKKAQLTDFESKQFLEIIKNLKICDQDFGIDSRVFGTIYNRKNVNNFCMSTTINEINQRKYFVDDQLRNFNIKLTK